MLEPTDTPKLRTIGVVTVNGGFTLDRNVVPEMDVSREQMDALGYTQAVQALEEFHRSSFSIPTPARRRRPTSFRCADPTRRKQW